jgi:Fe-S cluster biogenesis protein NfuA/nitrite reductase/ring-hydroxylating ferredoxin subunit
MDVLEEELLGEMLDLHGEALRRIWARVDGEDRDRLAADRVVAQVLLVHDLHPLPLEERVAAALEQVRPYLDSHGGGVELLSLEDGIATLLLQGSCKGCASSAATLELAIERALEEHAPDLLGVEVEGVAGSKRSPAPLVSLGSWHELDSTPEPGRLLPATGGLILANVAGTLLAYRDRCAGCGASLASASLEDGTLECPSCRRQFSLPLAGRALGPEELQLEPVPLLLRDGRVQVAA